MKLCVFVSNNNDSFVTVKIAKTAYSLFLKAHDYQNELLTNVSVLIRIKYSYIIN